MKIEKLTENKIRVILNIEDLDKTDINLNSILDKTALNQNFFLEILDKAEKNYDFHTDGCKLLIELFSSIDGVFVFTITKYETETSINKKSSSKNVKRKTVTAKVKSNNYFNKNVIYSFNNLEEFCELCSYINTLKNFDFANFSKNASLFLYNGTYYLLIKNININYKYTSQFYSIISEFGKLLPPSKSFEGKLVEHGSVIIKRNAIDIGIKYFV